MRPTIGFTFAIAIAFASVAPSSAADTPAAASERPEGLLLDVVPVEEGWGDGRVTERDARAFCEFCLWGVNELRAAAGYDAPLAGEEVLGRLGDFWVRVWEHMDQETKQTISVADVLWPAIREELDGGNEEFAASLAAEFATFADEVWGGYEDETLAYLDGSLPGFLYEQVVSRKIEEMLAASRSSRGGSVGGSVPSFSPYGDNYRDDLNTSYVVNDGSGDVMYIDE